MNIQALEDRIACEIDTWRKGNTHNIMAPGFAYMGHGASETEAIKDFLVRNGLETKATLMHYGENDGR